ncbi:alpha/beta hydrolase [Fulvimarina endophytica]|uniref:Alpha/beta hydrolase n=1 Tax=Fulvimarina endophytica TaxID=2293836 RepID=A0A371X0V4_9HYPH|nr:alpha/beta hydrolase [Fulvimarina endophytica]RFC62878.1 alpha/beta hydrolase [Fulvimarina endophytica]
MPFLTTNDDVDLFYNDWGSGRPIVLVHGWPLNADMWAFTANQLVERGHRVVAYDRRGFGRSEQPGQGYDYDTFSDDLANIMDFLQLENAVLAGFSMGGGEVARYMSRHQPNGKRVAKAALISAVTPYMAKDDSNPEGLDPATFEGFVKELNRDRPGFLSGFGKMFYGVKDGSDAVSQAYLDWTLQMAMMGSLRATIACVNAFGTTDFREDMKAFEVPTLIVHGTGDDIVPFETSAKKAASMIANAELKVYEGEPHGLHYTSQQRLVDDIAEFARS